MKAIKMIGLAALMALMAMAFVGATSAMAESTSLCTVDESNCKPENLVKSVHETSVGKAKLLTTFLTIECDVLFSGKVKETGSPLIIEGEFTYTNCGSCTVKEENGPTSIEVLRLSHETGDITGEGLVHAVCGKSLDCSYNGTGLLGTAKGPLLSTQKNGEVTLTKQKTNKEAGGFLCPATSELDITTTPLAATYVSEANLPLKIACIKTNRNNTGLWDNTACTVANGTNTGPYDLGWVESNLALTNMACAYVGIPDGWFEELEAGSGGEKCKTESGAENKPYELGVIVGP